MAPPLKYSNEELHQLALKFKTRTEFLKAYPGPAWSAKNRGIWDDICSHMVCGRRKWFINDIKGEIAKYSSRREFKERSPQAHTAAREMGVFYDLTSHWPLAKKSTPWTEEEAHHQTKKYSTLKEMRENDSGLYQYLYTKGLLDKIAGHLINRITDDEIYLAAKKHTKRYEFKINDERMYRAAVDRKILDDVCKHMSRERIDSGRSCNIVYMWKVINHDLLWKVGITYNKERLIARIKEVERSNQIECDYYYFNSVTDVYGMEKTLLGMGDIPITPFDGDGRTEFRLFDKETERNALALIGL